MTVLLQREKARNEAHLQRLRENARKLAFLNEATKSNDGSLNRDRIVSNSSRPTI